MPAPSNTTSKAPTVELPSASLPHEAEFERKQRLLEKVNVIREGLLAHRNDIKGKDPAQHYSWVHNSQARITNFQAMGYEIVRDPKIETSWRREDGTHVRGDLILMQISEEMYEAWQYSDAIRAIEGVEDSQGQFKEFAGRNGVPVYNPAIK